MEEIQEPPPEKCWEQWEQPQWRRLFLQHCPSTLGLPAVGQELSRLARFLGQKPRRSVWHLVKSSDLNLAQPFRFWPFGTRVARERISPTKHYPELFYLTTPERTTMTDFRTDRRTLLQLGALSAGSLFSNPAQQSSLPSQKMTNTTSVATHRGDLKHHTAALMTIDDEDVPATPIECRRLARGPNESLYAKAIKSHMEQYGSLDKVLARFSNIDEQPHPPLPTYEEHLSFFQADRLVGQAAGLLERCRVADIEFRDLSVKAFNLHQDTIAYDRAREILADEIGDGLLAVPADVSRAQFLAEFSNTKNINDALTSLANVNARYEKADFDLQIHDVKWLAWGNHYPANATPEQLQDTKAGGLDERAGKIPT